jgi:hypothetical protein
MCDGSGSLRSEPGRANSVLEPTLAMQAVLMIDDSYLDLDVAYRLGMYTALVSNGIAESPQFW